MDLGLEGKVAAVAAGSKGLGLASAQALADEGCDVAICARGAESLDAAAGDLRARGIRVHAMRADLADPDAPGAFIDGAIEHLGRVDIVVANNGGPTPGPIVEMDDDAFRGALDQNFLVTVRLARAALPGMRARRWGRIVAITSAAVKQPIPGLGLSNTARAAVAGWAKTLADEVAADGITVNTVAPGTFDTDRMRALGGLLEAMAEQIPVKRVGDARELGDLVAFLASDRAGYLTGTTIQIDGGMVRSLT